MQWNDLKSSRCVSMSTHRCNSFQIFHLIHTVCNLNRNRHHSLIKYGLVDCAQCHGVGDVSIVILIVIVIWIWIRIRIRLSTLSLILIVILTLILILIVIVTAIVIVIVSDSTVAIRDSRLVAGYSSVASHDSGFVTDLLRLAPRTSQLPPPTSHLPPRSFSSRLRTCRKRFRSLAVSQFRSFAISQFRSLAVSQFWL
jgi:hypothetical protein